MSARPDRTLILMRHAKSDWGDATLSDHDRPLNQRGLRDAPRMARWLAEQQWIPDRILCSSSRRTRETVDQLLRRWSVPVPVCYSESLYHSLPAEIVDNIAAAGGDAACLQVVAHNPGITSLVCRFADQSIEMPTAAIAVFDVEVDDWSELNLGSKLRLRNHIRPRQLPLE
jgi:phosphohistidine phosphatase